MLANTNLKADDTTELRIDPAKTIFWTGAGISSDPPSNLPLGNRLTDAYLKAMLGEKWKSFAALWNNYFPQIKESVKDGKWKKPEEIGKYTAEDIGIPKESAWQRPRLEYIIGEMDKLDKYFNSISFHKDDNKQRFSRDSSLAALSEFAKVEPCLAHYRLSDLAKAGATIITANFDDGIEKALHADSSKVIKQYKTDAVENGYDGFIYHIHGIATDDPDNLGATISSMSKGLEEDFQDYLKECFESGYNIVFIGYSGSDFFDVQPFFRSLKPGRYIGKAIYLKYCSEDSDLTKAIREEKPFQYLLDPFENRYIAYGNTEELFHAVFDSYSAVTVPTKDCGAFTSLCDYLDNIASKQVDKETFYFLNMFRLCSQLNISPGRFYDDWIERIRRLFYIWKADGKNTLENMTVISGQKNDGIVEDIYSNNWHDEDLTKTGMAKKLSPFIRKWEKKHRTLLSVFNRALNGAGLPLPKSVIERYLSQTIDILKNKKNDEKSIDICRSTVMYLCGHQTKLAIKAYIISHGHIKKRMLFIRDSIQQLLQFPFTRFRYRTHYLSLCRQAGYIDAAIHQDKKEYQGDIQHEWDICMQTPILFDAGQTIKSRLNQAKIYKIKDGTEELTEIQNLILDLRKPKSDLTE